MPPLFLDAACEGLVCVVMTAPGAPPVRVACGCCDDTINGLMRCDGELGSIPSATCPKIFNVGRASLVFIISIIDPGRVFVACVKVDLGMLSIEECT